MSKFRDVEDVVSAAARLQMTQVSGVARCLRLSLMPAFSNLSIPLPLYLSLHLLSSILPFFTLLHISLYLQISFTILTFPQPSIATFSTYT